MAERRGAALALALALGLAAAPGARAEDGEIRVETEGLRAVFSRQGALVALEALHQVGGERRSLVFARSSDPPLARVVSADPAQRAALEALDYALERVEREGEIVLRFSASAPDGSLLEQTWTVPRAGHVLALEARRRGPAAALQLELAVGPALEPRPWRGVGGLSERIEPVVVDAAGVREWRAEQGEVELAPGRWSGPRGRFWALLATSDAARGRPELPEGTWRGAEPEALQLRLYAGPVERASLAAADPQLVRLLFSGRIWPVRLLAFGLLHVFGALLRALGHVGLAIVGLALVVKLLLSPLAHLADRWQREVNRARSALAPGIAAIRAKHRGEERSRRLLALHREHGVHPLYGLKSLLGLAIQIPVFFAAYHMLDENVALAGSRFLWIADLSRPDRVAALPVSLPLLGDSLNLLPILMACATLLSSRLHDDGSLSAALLRRQRLGLYAMAGAFLLLFYTFPAGMVLYWTTGNVASGVRDALRRARSRARRGVTGHVYSR